MEVIVASTVGGDIFNARIHTINKKNNITVKGDFSTTNSFVDGYSRSNGKRYTLIESTDELKEVAEREYYLTRVTKKIITELSTAKIKAIFRIMSDSGVGYINKSCFITEDDIIKLTSDYENLPAYRLISHKELSYIVRNKKTDKNISYISIPVDMVACQSPCNIAKNCEEVLYYGLEVNFYNIVLIDKRLGHAKNNQYHDISVHGNKIPLESANSILIGMCNDFILSSSNVPVKEHVKKILEDINGN